MAKKLSFNGVEITTAQYGDMWFFHRLQASQSLGYKNSINYHGADPMFVIGNETFISLTALQEALSSATGERKTQAAGLLQRISEECNVSLALNKPGTLISDLPDGAAAWAKAKVELTAAVSLYDECKEKERDLWAQLEKERNNG